MSISNITKGRLSGLLFAVCFLLVAINARAQTQVTSPMTTTPSAGDYFSYTGITLSTGFSFTAASGQSLRLYIQDIDCQLLSTVPSSNQNYIMTSIPRQPAINPGGPGLSTCNLMQTIAYFDGLAKFRKGTQTHLKRNESGQWVEDYTEEMTTVEIQ
ncbi:hypothetical protein ABIB62_004624 [Mucilaginibacter sp. UYP25]